MGGASDHVRRSCAPMMFVPRALVERDSAHHWRVRCLFAVPPPWSAMATVRVTSQRRRAHGAPRMAKQKVYAVRRGRRPGIYSSWADVQEQTTGFRGAEFKSFATKVAAQAWLDDGHAPSGERPRSGIAVMGFSDGTPGPMRYGAVDVASGAPLFAAGPYDGGTTNLAEFLAIVDAIRLVAAGDHEGPIWTSSEIAMIWVGKGLANSTVDPRKVDPELRLQVTRAENWLAGHAKDGGEVPPLKKWDFQEWGEIPHDGIMRS